MRKNVFLFLQKHWGILILSAILLLIIAVNVKPGFLILGNDNFSPELDPALTFERQISSPAWRTYRVLGIPSDSEQADIFRAGLYVILEKFLPVWVVSQGYLFFSLFIASFSMGQVARYFVGKIRGIGESWDGQLAFLIGGLLYLCSMLTSWIYFFPVALFVAAYAFLPLTLWRMLAFLEKPNLTNSFWLLAASLLLTTSALTATMFLVGAVVLGVLGIVEGFGKKKILASAFFIIFGIQAFWFLPFSAYVQSNTPALKEGAIYRDITATTIENEARHNTAFNTIRYFSSWMDTKEDTKTFTFPYRDWYKNSVLATVLSLLPVLLGVLGGIWVVRSKNLFGMTMVLFAIAGWYFIKGINPPLGFVYAFVQDNFPTVAQIFRWQSSKMWPFLALTMPILGAIGVIGMIRAIGGTHQHPLIVKRPEHKSSQFRSSKSAIALVVVLVVGLLVYIYPYFTGNLVRESMYVQVPSEYKELAQYLKKTDSQSRIYLSPEANTLYFRNYSFGFWGSVLLNYIVPNPIIEKALIAGSFENEQAFDVITNSYFSEDSGTFAKALMRYNTPYILSDKYASAGTVGYPYDWELHKKVVEDNPFFEKVWQKGNLTLYRILNFQVDDQKTARPVYAESQVGKLNTILQALGNQDTYFTNDKTAGTVYPFALPFSNYTYVTDGISATHTYTGPSASYQTFVGSENIITSPAKLEYSLEKEEIVVTPLLPTLSVNNTPYRFTLPQKRYGVENQLAFITIDEQVIDARQLKTRATTGIPYGHIGKASIKTWTQVFEPLDIAHGQNGLLCKKVDKLIKCETSGIAIAKDTIVEADFRVSVNIPKANSEDEKAIQMLVCFESFNKKTCMNRNNSMFITKTGEARILIPWKFGAGDILKVYVDFKEQVKDTVVNIDRFVVKQYTGSEIASLKGESKTETLQVFQIPLRPQDTLSLTIPILEGPNSAPMRSDGQLIPEASTTAFEEGKPYESKIEVGKEGLEITNKESNSSIYPKLSYLDPRGGIAMLFADANNVSGIPLDVSVRNIQKPHRIWQTKLPYKKDAQNMHLFMLPQELQSYYFEAFSTGLGPRASTTVMKALYFQIVPKSWYGMKLELQDTPIGLQGLVVEGRDTNRYVGEVRGIGEIGGIVTIPTAIAPFWKLTLDGEEQKNRVVVNGWEQAWMVEKNGRAEVVFTPSALVYIGFAPLILIVGWIVVKSLALLRK